MKIKYTKISDRFLSKISDEDRGRVVRTAKFFEKNGFLVGPQYIKKVSRFGIWELRAGKIRLFLNIRGTNAVCVHAMYKKSQKLPLQDIRLAEKRSKEL